MKKTFTIYFKLALALIPAISLGQQSLSESLRLYPPQVILKIHEINSVTELSNQQQLSLARQFKEQDSLVAVKLFSQTESNISSTYKQGEQNIIRAVLSPLQWADYQTTPSVYASVLKFRKVLKLKPEQQTKLLSKYQQTADKISSPGETKLEYSFLYELLSKEQWENYFIESNRPKAIIVAGQEWLEMTDYGITAGLNKENSQALLEKFCHTRLYKLEMALACPRKVNYDSLRKSIDVIKPKFLIKSEGFRGWITGSRFGESLKYRDELGLSKVQIDSLVTEIAELDKRRYEQMKHYPEGSYINGTLENDKLIRILSPEQLNNYLIAKNKLKAKTNAIKDLEKLQGNGLTKNLDSKTIEKELYEYELNYLVASERFSMSNTPENSYQKRLAASKKPAALNELNHLESGKAATLQAKSQFSW